MTVKQAIVMLVAMVLGSAACGVESWLEKRHMDMLSGLFLGIFTCSLIALMVALVVHFSMLA